MAKGTSIPFMAWVTGLKRPDWTYTIEFRLVVGFAALLALCMFAVFTWSINTSRIAIRNFENEVQIVREQRARQLLQDVYASEDDIAKLRVAVQQIAWLFDDRVAVVDSDGRILADSHNSNVADVGGTQTTRAFFENSEGFRAVPVVFGEDDLCEVVFVDADTGSEPVAQFGAAPGPASQSSAGSDGQNSGSRLLPSFEARFDQIEPDFAGALDDMTLPTAEPTLSALHDTLRKSLTVSGIAGGLASVLFIIFFTRKAFEPVRELSHAAERLGKGELDQRVQSIHRGEIGSLANTFNTMASDLQAAETRRRRVTADIAHELRTPLSNILGYLEAIKDGIVDPDSQTVEILHRETTHLSALVDDLRFIAVADAGALNLDKGPDRIEAIVESVVKAFEPRAIEADLLLDCYVEPGLPLIDIDRTRMTQVIENLLANAIDHSFSCGKITVRAWHREDIEGVNISVTDEGAGISAENIGQIFEQFYRVDSSRTRATGGAGLGLTIAKRLVDAHGGEIKVASIVNSGSTFTISLPASEVRESDV